MILNIPFFRLTLILCCALNGMTALGKEEAQKPFGPSNIQYIEQTVQGALEQFNTPGAALGVVYRGEVALLKGFGKKDFQRQDAVDKNTFFRLASASKALTAASLAILVDEGKLNWHDKVTDHMPHFRMMHLDVSMDMKIVDLLTHKSGLVSGAGDSMLWPEPSGFKRAEIIHNLRYLTPEYGFREQYAYNNVLYIVAGEIVSLISGQPWEKFVDERIFKRLNMNCYAGDIPARQMENVAIPHGDKDGNSYYIHRNGIHGRATVSAAAGGVVCNAADMLKWLTVLLDRGKLADGSQLFSEERLEDMWRSYTILPISEKSEEWDNTHFRTYGLGWRKSDVHGYHVVSHTGTLSGMQAYVLLIPELELGVVTLNNGSNWGVRTAIMKAVLATVIPSMETLDWVDTIKGVQNESEIDYLENLKTPVSYGQVQLSNEDYTGTFEDRWYGKVELSLIGNEINVQFDKMRRLSGRLEPFKDHSFVIRWFDQNAASDAFIHFEVDVNNQVKGFRLHPYSVEQLERHEWRDMRFVKEQ